MKRLFSVILISGMQLISYPFAQSNNKNIQEVFIKRAVWQNFPKASLEALVTRFSTLEQAEEFIKFSEETKILYNYFPEYFSTADLSMLFGSIATVFTSYANQKGGEGVYPEAKRALQLAILIKPRHLPAYTSLALVYSMIGDCKNAVIWANNALTFKPRIDSDDPWEAGIAFSLTVEGEKVAKQAGIKGGEWEEIQSMMRSVIKKCQK